jgi:hypothetical protein
MRRTNSRGKSSWSGVELRVAIAIAILLAIFLLSCSKLDAQQQRDSARVDSAVNISALTDSAIAARVGYRRSVKTAVVLGAVVPGAGHLYAGEWLKSYPIFLASAGGIWVGSLVYNFDRCTFNWSTGCRSGVPTGARVAGAALVVGGAYVWISNAIDAGRAVERQRRRRALAARYDERNAR